jgi:hypothetical protein
MHFKLEFDDLNDLVVALRGRFGRDGMLLHTDAPHPAGTILELDISLAGDASLLHGTVGVIRLLEPPSDRPGGHLVVVEFLDLDADSEAFVGRLAARFEADGVELFRLDRYVRHGRRDFSEEVRPVTTPPGPGDAVSETPSQRLQGPLLSPPGDPRPKTTRRSKQAWVLGALLAALVVILATSRFLSLGSTSTAPVVDHGIPLGAAVGSPPDTAELPLRAEGTPSRDEAPSPRPAEPPQPQPTVHAATRLERITWRQGSARTAVVLEADGRILPDMVSHGRMESAPGPRVALYLAAIAAGDVAYRTEVSGPRLKAIRVWYHDDASPPELHVVLDLAGPGVTASAPQVDGRRIVVTLGSPPGRGASSRPSATP